MFFHCLARRLVAQAALAATLGVSCPAVAQAAKADTAPAPIRQALQSAWQQHPEYRITEAQLTAARARLQAAAQPLYNPALEFSNDDEGPERTTTAGLSLDLDLSGKRRVRRDAASAQLDLSTALAHLRRRDFTRQWITAWADWQAARQRANTGERRLSLVSRFSDLADKQYAADDISGLERDLAQLARDEAQAEQSQLLTELAQAQARFRSSGGDPDTIAGLDLPSVQLPAPTTASDELQALPDWQAAQAAVLASEGQVQVARRNRIADPTLTAYGGRKAYEAGGPSEHVFGFSVSVPLFVRNRYRAEVVAAQADADLAQAQFERIQLELQAERRRAIDSYTATHAAWSRWQRSAGTAVERRAELLERLWREGELSTADYLLQLKQSLDTQLAGAELQARLWRTYTDYLAAIGRLEDWAGLERSP